MTKPTIRDKMIAETGVDPRRIYCQITGKTVGFLSRLEYNELLAILPPDEDEAIDELLTRTLMSTRPSPVWNFQRSGRGSKDMMTQRAMREPQIALAYYLNRLDTPVTHDGTNPLVVGKEANLGAIHNRIKLLQRLDRSVLDLKARESLLYTLVELDCRFDLRKLAFPHNLLDLFIGQPQSLVRLIQTWATGLIDAQRVQIEKQQKRGLIGDDPYQNGNKRSGQLFATMFIRNTPLSEKTADKLAKVSRIASIMDQFDSFEEALTKPDAKPKVYPSLAEIKADPSLLDRKLPNKPEPKKIEGFVFGRAS